MNRYPKLLITVKHETDERFVTETCVNPRKRRSKNQSRPNSSHPTTIYYNSNHRPKPHFVPPAVPQRYDRFQHQKHPPPVRPLMEIKNFYNEFDEEEIAYLTFKQREPRQRGQYRNRKAELDWDHAFDLDQLHLYTTQHDIDNHSLTSFHSSSDNSFASV